MIFYYHLVYILFNMSVGLAFDAVFKAVALWKTFFPQGILKHPYNLTILMSLYHQAFFQNLHLPCKD